MFVCFFFPFYLFFNKQRNIMASIIAESLYQFCREFLNFSFDLGLVFD